MGKLASVTTLDEFTIFSQEKLVVMQIKRAHLLSTSNNSPFNNGIFILYMALVIQYYCTTLKRK